MSNNVRHIAVYFAVITLVFGLSTGISAIPVAFFLKDVLKLSPQKMAAFGALTAIPSYFGFVLGYLRDQWKPLGQKWGDRGFFLVAPPVSATCYLYLASDTLTYKHLLTALLVAGVSNGLIGVALGGFMAATARHHAMTGRLTSVFLFINMVPGILTSLAGGWLTTHFPPQRAFLLSALFSLSVIALGFWKPSFFVHAAETRPEEGEYTEALRALPGLREQLRSLAFWCAFAVSFLWNFCPGWGTPLFFQLTNTVKLSEQQYGYYGAILQAFVMLGTLLYSMLCRLLPLSRLLWLGTILGIVASFLFLLIHNAVQAYCVAAFLGFLLGMTGSTFMDLALRTYLPGREGVAGALVTAGINIAAVTSDLFGAWLYERGGFILALGVSLLFTILILPVLLFIPVHIRHPREGELLASEIVLSPVPT